MDLVDNLGRCRFSSAQMKLILWLLRELGVANVPSYGGFRAMQKKIRQLSAGAPSSHESVFGNRFYTNDIRETIARVRNRSVVPSPTGYIDWKFRTFPTRQLHHISSFTLKSRKTVSLRRGRPSDGGSSRPSS